MKKILLVDDELEVLAAETELLQSWNYNVTAVNSTKKAIKMLKKDTFDLVLLDILMPIMTGRELAQYIRNDPRIKEQKIVFLSVVQLGEAGELIIKELNPVDYVTKPFDIKDLRKRLKKILGE
jgi:CheY-like chemotaxis protein